MLSKLGKLWARFVCSKVGHEPSWTRGVMFGFKRPVCDRCDERL